MTNVIDFDRIFLFSPTPCLILFADTSKFTIAEVNAAYLEIANVARDQLIGKSFFEAFPAGIADWQDSLHKVVADKLPHQTPTQRYEFAGNQNAGIDVKYFDTLNVPILNKENEVEYIICYATQDVTDKIIMEKALLQTRDKFQSLIHTVDGIVWEADAVTFEFTFISDKVKSILGYTPEEWLSDPSFWKKHIHPDDREQAADYCHSETQRGNNHTFDYRMIKADAGIVWIRDIVSVISENGKPIWLRGLMIDITEVKRLADLDRLEKAVLELNSKKGVPIEEVLSVYLRGIEALFNQMHFSIMQIRNNRLHNWAAPSLPKSYIDYIENLQIGPNTGSCGTAAYLKEIVIASDIENDVRWKDYKQFALPYNLRACWSYPIINSENDALAVFGVYYQEERKPQEEEIKVIERSAAILKIILENKKLHTELEEHVAVLSVSEKQYSDLFHLSPQPMWIYDLNTLMFLNVNDSAISHYGYSRKEFLQMTVKDIRPVEEIPDLLEATSIAAHQQAKHHIGMFNHRKKNGELIQVDIQSNSLKFGGKAARIVLINDITERQDYIKAIEDQNNKLQEIAWIQSHVVRVPVAKVMSLTELLKDEHITHSEKMDFLDKITDSTNQLDEIIRDISERAQKIRIHSAKAIE